MVVEAIEREKMFRPFKIVVESKEEWEMFSLMLDFCQLGYVGERAEKIGKYAVELESMIYETAIEATGSRWVQSHQMTSKEIGKTG